jgi:hypothetical protein
MVFGAKWREFSPRRGLPSPHTPPANQSEARALTTSFIDDTVMPKILRWSLGVQRELYRNATVEVRYLGTRLELPVQYRRNFKHLLSGCVSFITLA